MKVGEIIDRLNKKEPLMVVAKQLGMMPHLLSKKLRTFGYEYDSEKKKRVFVGEGEEPREWSIWSDVPIPATEMVLDYQKLMYEELCHIRLMLEGRQERITSAKENEKRLRRVFTLPLSLLQLLDEVSSRRGVHKSKIVEEALQSFLEKYT